LGLERLRQHFGVPVVQAVAIAQPFCCHDLPPHPPLPLDRQWIYASIKLIVIAKHGNVKKLIYWELYLDVLSLSNDR
jgi:hypothetical protein